jgi:hypothetical protein
MADTFKVLAQVAPTAATLTTLYTVPGATSTVVSSIVAANTSATPTSIRISVQIAAAADNIKQYIAYDVPIGPNEVINFQLGVSLATTDVVKVYNTLATVSFSAFGVEVT